MRTPVAFVIFNRPDCTRRVFAEIAKARPEKLFLIADGPRPGNSADARKCAETREVVKQVDWDCEVFEDFSEANLGCGRRISSGISWVFRHVDEAIILEDDCLPDTSFFPFCAELLEKYRDEERVMTIGGTSLLGGKTRPSSYFFGRNIVLWGWATWRRAWQHQDMSMARWPELRDSGWLQEIVGHDVAVKFWQKTFDRVYARRDSADVSEWIAQWTFNLWIRGGLGITSVNNLISNIGFRADATHTPGVTPMADLKIERVTFPLRHPPHVTCDGEADELIFANAMLPQLTGDWSQSGLRGSVWQRAVGRLRRHAQTYLAPSVR